ncbi:MAG: triose-phosphate isomerase [Cyclobacteriaceae bacterium]|nr:triose-phosphate isomerase [Cyclobacteriaceae bacterium]
MRQKIVAGNWKMNNTIEEGQKLTSEIVDLVKNEVTDDVSIIIAPSFIHLSTTIGLLEGVSNIALSSQNCSENESGAFTGEVSVNMLNSIGVEYVIIGHSERREYNHETNEQLTKKVDTVLKHGLTPIFCCGETLATREGGNHFEYVCNQLTESLFHLSEDDFKKVVIAYEPIWAIGTGVTASSDQAQEMHAALRSHLATKYGKEIADNTSILYGGSCKPDNAKELFACADVDGGLIGGASLKSRDFVDIAKSF